ncbi:MAG: HAMP domain-containing histidine kinase, partial [Bacteroidetes bacterium]|nr:HAMP domain-containing histidine kinase [Bacteroidota bacterium]
NLKNIINETLAKKSIHTEFEFGVTEYTLNNFVFVSSGAALEELYDTKYSVTLFKGNIYESAKQLMLTFPNRRQYMLNSLWLPLSFSTLFLLLVIGSFGLALYIILRQKQLSAMKMDFINNMTHELKTPISTISLASQMLKDEGIAAQSASRLKYAGMIYDENKRLANQVEKVLQMARMENGDIKYNKNPIDVHELLEIALNQFYIQVEDSGGELIQSLNAKESIIMADELHLTNVVNNLLDNALKYNDKEVPVIEVSTALDGDDILISVEDNGMGLKKDELNKIFDQFYRVNKGDVHDTKGFGIGLSYVKSIVQAHNGTITVQSQFSKGTTFTIRLPLKKA